MLRNCCKFIIHCINGQNKVICAKFIRKYRENVNEIYKNWRGNYDSSDRLRDI